MDFIRGFDAFPKIESSYKKQTIIGGITSVIVGTFLITLVLSEVILYLKPSLNYSFVVDSNIDQNIQINLDISVATPCSSLITIATDVSNETLVLNNFLSAKKINYSKADPKSNFLSRILFDLNDGKALEGCRITGSFPVKKVSGRIQIMGTASLILGEVGEFYSIETNFSHVIHSFSFGERFPGLASPLDGSVETARDIRTSYKYYLSVIPTIYGDFQSRNPINTNQYSVTEVTTVIPEEPNKSSISGIFFQYSLEPISVNIAPAEKSFLGFLIKIVGILGGIYVCSGLLYRIIDFCLFGIFENSKTNLSSSRNIQATEMTSLLSEVTHDKQ